MRSNLVLKIVWLSLKEWKLAGLMHRLIWSYADFSDDMFYILSILGIKEGDKTEKDEKRPESSAMRTRRMRRERRSTGIANYTAEVSLIYRSIVQDKWGIQNSIFHIFFMKYKPYHI